MSVPDHIKREILAKAREGEREFSTYQKIRRQWTASIAEGPGGHLLLELEPKLKALGNGLTGRDFIQWLSGHELLEADRDVRFVALDLIDTRAERLRILAGGTYLDDPMPHQPDSLFIICKRLLNRKSGL